MAAIKPAIAGSAVIASATGGYVALDRWDANPPHAFQQVQSAGQQLLISEFGVDADTIVSVDPADPSSRVEIARVRHAPGWGIFASLSPDGRAIANTALPEDAAQPSPATPATVAVVDTGGDVRVLAVDADLLVTPVWSPDSASVVVRRSIPAEDGAGAFELLLLGRDGSRSTITTWTTAAVFPIAFSPDGATLYYAALNAAGTDLYRVAPDGAGEALVAHLSDDVARDWKLSPDGATLAFTVVTTGENPAAFTSTLDLATGAVTPAGVAGASAEFNPIWAPDGDLTMAAMGARGGVAVAVGADGSLAALTDGEGVIDVPLGWSPDGELLALRSVEGATPLDAGASALEIVGDSGERTPATGAADALIVGWLE
jgi:hypothetical protein